MASIKEGTGCALVGIAYPVIGILGLIIHIWTIVIAYNVSGLIGAIVTLIFPVLSQIYWFIKVWSFAGTVLNFYCIAILAYVGGFIVMFVGISMMDS